MIYFDNAATSFPKPERVYDEISRCMHEYCANPGRGGHFMSLQSGKAVLEARESICSLFNISNPMQLSFTKNATEALNMAVKGILRPGDHVITTSMEHNSVIRPIKTLERDKGIEVSIVQGGTFGEIDPDDIRKCIKPNTKLIACTVSSNVNGIIMPVTEVGKISRENGVCFLVDGSQGAGTIKIDVEEMNIDMLAIPGHKGLMGPQGTGCLYVREGIVLSTLLEGGTGSNSENMYQPDMMPDLLESGTLNTPGIVGLAYGVKFIQSFGLENISIYKHQLVKRFMDGIREIKGIHQYSKEGINNNSGIVALNFEGVDSTEISYVLDKVYHIATRAGLHCAPLAHRTLGTGSTGIVRISFGCFNTFEEVDGAINAFKEISQDLFSQ